MEKSILHFRHLMESFPQIKRMIKVYIGMDQDFERVCMDFEEVSMTLHYLENAKGISSGMFKQHISEYRQLKEELSKEIKDFIKEEKNTSTQKNL